MIEMLFHFGPEIILIKIDGTRVSFGNTTYGAQLSPIDGLKLDKAGVEKQFPDLKGNPAWKEKAIHRFKKHIAELRSEKERAKYVEQDLIKHGYILKKVQETGMRPRSYL
jgi:hypothetical protein